PLSALSQTPVVAAVRQERRDSVALDVDSVQKRGVRRIVVFFSSRRRHTKSVSAFLLNRSSDLLNTHPFTFLFGVIILIANILKRAFSSQLAAKLRNRLLVL